MNHSYSMEGYGYLLRPIKCTDVAFIIEVRLEDLERNRFVHPISSDVSEQEAWLDRYFKRNGDYYFVVENQITKKREGLIAFYNEMDGKAEWGRWVLKKESLAAAASVYLLYRIAFEQVGLQELYCRTVADNTRVVSFHTHIGEKMRCRHKEIFEINGTKYDAVEQYSDRGNFYRKIFPLLEKRAQITYQFIVERYNALLNR